MKDYVPSFGKRSNDAQTVSQCKFISPLCISPLSKLSPIVDFAQHFKEIAKQCSPQPRPFRVHLTSVIVRLVLRPSDSKRLTFFLQDTKATAVTLHAGKSISIERFGSHLPGFTQTLCVPLNALPSHSRGRYPAITYASPGLDVELSWRYPRLSTGFYESGQASYLSCGLPIRDVVFFSLLRLVHNACSLNQFLISSYCRSRCIFHVSLIIVSTIYSLVEDGILRTHLQKADLML